MHAHTDPIDIDIDLEAGVGFDDANALLEARLRDDHVDVPPFPRTLLALQELAGRDAGIAAYVDVAKADPVLAARVLRVAHSASFGRIGSGTVTLENAVRSLGTQMLRRIALADGLAPMTANDGPLVVLRDEVWRRAVSAAVLAAAAARDEGVDPDEAFVCGLLHDFGRILVLRELEKLFVDRPLDAAALGAPVWRRLVDAHARAYGTHAAVDWRLPPLLQKVIARDRRDPAAVRCIELLDQIDVLVDLLDRGDEPTAARLAELQFLTAALPSLSKAIDTLPEALNSFAVERARPAAAAIAVQTPAPAPPTSLTATTVGSTTARTFDVRQLTPRGVVLLGGAGLACHQVFRLRFAFAAPQDVWLRITACLPRPDGRCEVHAVPFALKGDEAAAWYARVHALAGATPPAAPAQRVA